MLIPSALGNLWSLFVCSESSGRERGVVSLCVGDVVSDSVHRDVFVLSVRFMILVLCQTAYWLSADGLFFAVMIVLNVFILSFDAQRC